MGVFVGIDVSKDRLDVFVRPEGEAFQVSNDQEGIESLITRLHQINLHLVVLEATGGYENLVLVSLTEAGIKCSLVNPRQVRQFAQACGKLAKTDTLDAKVIAHFGEAINPPPVTLPDEETRIFSEILARRRQLIGMKIAEQNRCGKVIKGKIKKGIVSVQFP